jgi:hypothetical protein
MTGRLLFLDTLLAILLVVAFLSDALATTREAQQPGSSLTSWSYLGPDREGIRSATAPASLSVPEGIAGPVRVSPTRNAGTPAGAGRWSFIRTYWYGGSDGLDDGTHHFADGGVFREGTFAVAMNSVPLGSWVVLRWHDRSLLVQVRDRHGKSVRDFVDMTRAASAWLFGVPRNATVSWRRVTP